MRCTLIDSHWMKRGSSKITSLDVADNVAGSVIRLDPIGCVGFQNNWNCVIDTPGSTTPGNLSENKIDGACIFIAGGIITE